ncbi:MAG: hypothetical protein AB8B96_03105 [Lysobacterales bacterium]
MGKSALGRSVRISQAVSPQAAAQITQKKKKPREYTAWSLSSIWNTNAASNSAGSIFAKNMPVAKLAIKNDGQIMAAIPR